MPRKAAAIGLLLSCCAAFGVPAQSLVAGPTVAQIAATIPPPAPGLARVWFLRQYQPGESLRTPMMFVSGAPLANSVPGTALFRDFPPGAYTFSVETCTLDTNQATALSLVPGSQVVLEVQSLSSFSWVDCPRDFTFYMRPIPPERAQLYYTQLTYLGPR